jgi:hypothetical protein
MPSSGRARNRAGMITVSGLPTTSPAVQPNSRSAPLDQGAELLGDPGDALQPARLTGPLVGDEQLEHRHHPSAPVTGTAMAMASSGRPRRSRTSERSKAAQTSSRE